MEKIPFIVETDWLQERLDDPKLRLLDATTFLDSPTSGKEVYDKGHIPGAVFADLYELSDPDAENLFTVPSKERFIEKITALGVGDDTYVVIYDKGEAGLGKEAFASIWASRLAWQLRYEGFNNAAVLDGGLLKWEEENREITTEPGSYPKGTFSGERRPELLATKEDILKAMRDENTIIIDSLFPENYREAHIPNSINVFFGSLTDPATNKLYENGQIRERLEKLGILDPNKKVITYCGVGIAATWNALLLNELGQNNVAVYDGSLGEWSKDPNLPLVKGEK